MIRRYIERNGYSSNVEESHVTWYADQMFNHLMDKFNDGQQKHVITSEYLSLSDELRDQLLRFDDEDNMVLSPFLKTLSISSDDIVLMDEYEWTLSHEALSKFKAMEAGQTMFADEERLFCCSNGGEIWFRMCLSRKTSGSEYVGFGIRIEQSCYPVIDGIFSVRIDEVHWYRNDYRFYNLCDTEMIFAFDDDLVNKTTMNELTIRFAMTMMNATPEALKDEPIMIAPDDSQEPPSFQVEIPDIFPMMSYSMLGPNRNISSDEDDSDVPTLYEEAITMYNVRENSKYSKAASCISDVSNVSRSRSRIVRTPRYTQRSRSRSRSISRINGWIF